MKKKFIVPSLMLASSLLFGCAASYKAVVPESITYVKDNNGSPEASLEYHYNVLTESRNKKYYKKEIKKSFQVVALKITNNTDVDLEYNKNYQLYSGQVVLNVVPNQLVYTQLKQQAPLYWLYLLLTPVKLYTSTATTNGSTITSSNTESFPIGLILGPGIAIGNYAIASSANSKFKKELDTHSIFNKVIKKGETAFMLVGINSTSFQPIHLRLTKPNSPVSAN